MAIKRSTARVLVLVSAVGIASPPLLAQQIVPQSQDRSLTCTAINPRCQPASRSQNIDATNFEPFQEQIEILLACGGAIGRSAVSQRSEINSLAILASGQSRAQGSSDTNLVIHAIGGSFFEVTFTIDAPTTYTLSGELRAVRFGPQGQGASAAASLHGSGDLPLASFGVSAPVDGTEVRQPIAAGAAIAPGTYRLRANAWTVIDTTVPPNAGDEADFALRFEIQPRCPTDLNGDQLVDLHDLTLLLSEFGCTGDACLSDIDGDDATALADLALLLGDFGTTCP